MVQGPTPANGGANGRFYLRAIPSSEVHHFQAPRRHHRRIDESTSTSLNWSGYAIETSLTNPASNAVSDVTGGWTVPTGIKTASGDAYAAVWVGIDGYSSDTVEQIGTLQEATPKGVSYYAWFEMYPGGMYEIVNFPVVPGDTIAASVQYTGSKTIVVREGRGRETTEVVENFLLTIANLTHTATFSTTQQIQSAQRSSAEWVAEAPSSGNSVLPLADFGVVDFFDCDATVNGVTGPINDSAWQYDEMTMETSGKVIKALPSALTTVSGSSDFSVAWEHQ
jgi:hypothetical protein